MSFQKNCIESIKLFLKNDMGDFSKTEIKNCIRNAAECYYDKNGKECKIWTNTAKRSNWEAIKNTLLITEDAFKYIDSLGSQPLSVLTKQIQLEHLTPVSQTYSDIISTGDVEECMKYDRVAYISKDECSKYLDGAGCIITQDDIDLAKKMFNTNLDLQSSLNKRANSNGHALVRLAKLIKNGVKFIDYKDRHELIADEIYNRLTSTFNLVYWLRRIIWTS